MAHELARTSAGDVTRDGADEGALTRSETIAGLVRVGLGLVAFLGVMAILAAYFRGPIERLGHAFVGRFGAPGMAVGAFLADGAHFPLPPQFYLLAGEAGGLGRGVSIASVLTGSILGGLFAFFIGGHMAKARFIERRIRGPRKLVESLFERRRYVGVAIAGLLPISFWVICALAGALRLPLRAYGVLAIVRVPRLLVSYALVALAWTHHAPPSSTTSRPDAATLRTVAAPDRTDVLPCHGHCDRVAKLQPEARSFVDALPLRLTALNP